jgi:metal-responsive CopG/Arc/MetJ family transcriptional regulator
MKIKTSLTLSEELLSVIDKKSVGHKSRSDFIENALWTYLNYLIRQESNRIDQKIINKKSGVLNKEAEDVLEYQGLI